MVAARMRLPLDIEFMELTACKMTVPILRSSRFNEIIRGSR